MLTRNVHQPPSTRINNTASTSFVVPQSSLFEEEKKFDNPMPSPIEDYKQQYAYRNDEDDSRSTIQ